MQIDCMLHGLKGVKLVTVLYNRVRYFHSEFTHSQLSLTALQSHQMRRAANDEIPLPAILKQSSSHPLYSPSNRLRPNTQQRDWKDGTKAGKRMMTIPWKKFLHWLRRTTSNVGDFNKPAPQPATQQRKEYTCLRYVHPCLAIMSSILLAHKSPVDCIYVAQNDKKRTLVPIWYPCWWYQQSDS